MVLSEGGPVPVSSEAERIGSGPWARLLASAVVGDESSIAAERARSLARAGRVHGVTVEPGEIAASVTGSGGHEQRVTLGARLLPARIWTAVCEAAQGEPTLEGATRGREQSVHLQHGLAADWGEPLVPRANGIRAACSCAQAGNECQHIAAVAYVLADAIDADPSLLLRWRGCEPAGEPGAPRRVESRDPQLPAGDPWSAGPLPEPAALRPLPAGAVLMRLGPSGVTAGGKDLSELLRRAYDTFAS